MRLRLRWRGLRLTLPLLVAVSVITLGACGGNDQEAAAPLPVAQRFLTAEDAPGSKPDPAEKRQTTVKFDEFITALSDFSINPDKEEMTAVFKEAGFHGAGADARFYGETHAPMSPHVFSSFIELDSEDGATSALDWLETDQKKACRMSCAVQRSEFDVSDVPQARGVHRSATPDDVKRLGNEHEQPFDGYWIGFNVGPIVYTVNLQGPPGSVSEEQALEIASAYHDRLTGN